MASLTRIVYIDARPEDVWAAISDFAAVHERAARGFVLESRLEGDTRVLTFANGLVASERLVGLDHESRRIAYATSSPRIAHPNASLQVFPDGEGRSRVVWTTDVLPETVVETFETMLDHGARAMKATIENAFATTCGNARGH
jgi:carbon monoxide dehydrogenase subunit G